MADYLNEIAGKTKPEDAIKILRENLDNMEKNTTSSYDDARHKALRIAGYFRFHDTKERPGCLYPSHYDEKWSSPQESELFLLRQNYFRELTKNLDIAFNKNPDEAVRLFRTLRYDHLGYNKFENIHEGDLEHWCVKKIEDMVSRINGQTEDPFVRYRAISKLAEKFENLGETVDERLDLERYQAIQQIQKQYPDNLLLNGCLLGEMAIHAESRSWTASHEGRFIEFMKENFPSIYERIEKKYENETDPLKKTIYAKHDLREALFEALEKTPGGQELKNRILGEDSQKAAVNEPAKILPEQPETPARPAYASAKFGP